MKAIIKENSKLILYFHPKDSSQIYMYRFSTGETQIGIYDVSLENIGSIRTALDELETNLISTTIRELQERKPLHSILTPQPKPKDWLSPTWEELLTLQDWIEKNYQKIYDLRQSSPQEADQRERELENLVAYLIHRKFPPNIGQKPRRQ